MNQRGLGKIKVVALPDFGNKPTRGKEERKEQMKRDRLEKGGQNVCVGLNAKTHSDRTTSSRIGT